MVFFSVWWLLSWGVSLLQNSLLTLAPPPGYCWLWNAEVPPYPRGVDTPSGCPYGTKLHMVPKTWKWKCSAFTQPCPALCDPMNCSPPDSAVHEIFQARTPEWVVIPFSRESSQPRDRTQASCIAGRSLPLSHQGRPLCHEGEKKVKAAQSCLTLCDPMIPKSHVWLLRYSPWNFLGQDTGVGSLSRLQGVFPTQGSNPGLLHCRWILYQLSHKGSPLWWWWRWFSQ